jgi:hypothetical protein
MMDIINRLKINFDKNGNITISKSDLLSLIKQISIFSEDGSFPIESYLLVDKNGKDFYPFPMVELEEWINDGSCEPGDALYKMQLIKKY